MLRWRFSLGTHWEHSSCGDFFLSPNGNILSVAKKESQYFFLDDFFFGGKIFAATLFSCAQWGNSCSVANSCSVVKILHNGKTISSGKFVAVKKRFILPWVDSSLPLRPCYSLLCNPLLGRRAPSCLSQARRGVC